MTFVHVAENAATQTSAIQTGLATGRKINTALDNPTSYFTASALNARASDLSALGLAPRTSLKDNPSDTSRAKSWAYKKFDVRSLKNR